MQVWFEENKQTILLMIGGVIIILAGFVLVLKVKRGDELLQAETMISTEMTSPVTETQEVNVSEKWFVDIKGAVCYPGMYPVQTEMRVFDVIELAGGLLEEADRNQINLAEHVSDQMVIYIPKVGENLEDVTLPTKISQAPTNVSQSQADTSTIVNINQATSQELQTLSGIGEKKAEAIIEYRETHGSFQTVDDLKKVKGIGEKTFESLKESITIN